MESNDRFQGRLVAADIENCGCCIEMGDAATACFTKQFSVETPKIVFIYLLTGRRGSASTELCLASLSVPQRGTVKIFATQKLKSKLKCVNK